MVLRAFLAARDKSGESPTQIAFALAMNGAVHRGPCIAWCVLVAEQSCC
jgi:hypothetical protein